MTPRGRGAASVLAASLPVLLQLGLLSMQHAQCAARLVTFDNTKPRLDASGAVLTAHDGTTQRFGAWRDPGTYAPAAAR